LRTGDIIVVLLLTGAGLHVKVKLNWN